MNPILKFLLIALAIPIVAIALVYGGALIWLSWPPRLSISDMIGLGIVMALAIVALLVGLAIGKPART